MFFKIHYTALIRFYSVDIDSDLASRLIKRQIRIVKGKRTGYVSYGACSWVFSQAPRHGSLPIYNS